MLGAAPAEYSRAFSKEDVNTLPLFRYEGPVALIRTEEELADAVAQMEGEILLGLDTESKPCFRKGAVSPPALIQIACSDMVFLIQTASLPFGKALYPIMDSPACVKTGVAIGDDIRLLHRLYPFSAAGLVDLGDVARAKGLTTCGLRALAANFLHLRISKSAQCSNWGNRELTPQQVVYAATDAWVSRLIYERMSELGFFAEDTTFRLAPKS